MAPRKGNTIAIKLRSGKVKLVTKRGPSMHRLDRATLRNLHPWADYEEHDMSFWKHKKTGEPVKLIEQDAQSQVTFEDKAGKRTTVPSHVFFGERDEMTPEEVEELAASVKAPATK